MCFSIWLKRNFLFQPFWYVLSQIFSRAWFKRIIVFGVDGMLFCVLLFKRGLEVCHISYIIALSTCRSTTMDFISWGLLTPSTCAKNWHYPTIFISWPEELWIYGSPISAGGMISLFAFATDTGIHGMVHRESVLILSINDMASLF